MDVAKKMYFNKKEKLEKFRKIIKWIIKVFLTILLRFLFFQFLICYIGCQYLPINEIDDEVTFSFDNSLACKYKAKNVMAWNIRQECPDMKLTYASWITCRILSSPCEYRNIYRVICTIIIVLCCSQVISNFRGKSLLQL